MKEKVLLVGSVIGRIMSTRQDLRQFGGQISPLVAQSVQKANKLAQDEGLAHIETILANEAPHMLEGRKKQEREGLPELKNVDGIKPVFRIRTESKRSTLLWACTRCCHQRNLFQRT